MNSQTSASRTGRQRLEFHHPRGWVDASYLILKGGMPLAQLVASNQFMLFDATTKDIGEAGDGLGPSFRQVFVIYNSSSGGWQQYGAFDFPVAADDGLSANEPSHPGPHHWPVSKCAGLCRWRRHWLLGDVPCLPGFGFGAYCRRLQQ